MGAAPLVATKGAGPTQGRLVANGQGRSAGKWVTSPSYRIAIVKLVGARHKAGMTQRDLADALGKPHSWVAKVEQGERRLDLVEFIAVARALGLKEADLLKIIAADLPKRIEI
jgi:ribosome-binding protein aMBF1 (putative translation factor)